MQGSVQSSDESAACQLLYTITLWTLGVTEATRIIDNCLHVTEEVWRRRDLHQSRRRTALGLFEGSGIDTSWQKELYSGRLFLNPSQMDAKSTGKSGNQESDACKSDEPTKNTLKPRADSGSIRFPSRPSPQHSAIGTMDPLYSVRGPLHWIGVMCDWRWEGEPPSVPFLFELAIASNAHSLVFLG